jgi:hypothetical protein
MKTDMITGDKMYMVVKEKRGRYLADDTDTTTMTIIATFSSRHDAEAVMRECNEKEQLSPLLAVLEGRFFTDYATWIYCIKETRYFANLDERTEYIRLVGMGRDNLIPIAVAAGVGTVGTPSNIASRLINQ